MTLEEYAKLSPYPKPHDEQVNFTWYQQMINLNSDRKKAAGDE